MHHKQYTLDNLGYMISYPDNFDETKTYPVIFFMHGAGNRGNDINKLFDNAYFQILPTHKDFPFITVAPHCSADTWFELWQPLKNLVHHITTLPFVDVSRIYLMGVSMGGYGAWQLGMSLPQYFAAMVPICGGGMYWNADQLVNVPVWAFHGGKDDIVFPEESIKMVNAVNKYGGNAKLTIYEDSLHSVWFKVYPDQAVYDWLLSHKNENTKALINLYDDLESYG